MIWQPFPQGVTDGPRRVGKPGVESGAKIQPGPAGPVGQRLAIVTHAFTLAIERLYESPYIDFSPRGVDGVFDPKEVDLLVAILEDVRKRAVI